MDEQQPWTKALASPGLMFLLFMGIGSCIDPLNLTAPPVDYQLVIDGLITNEPGPYTVRLYRVRPLTRDLDEFVVEKMARITLFDNLGNQELLAEVAPGIYETSPDGTRGEIGKSYHLEIETERGGRFYTEPDEIQPVGEVESIQYEFVPGPFENGVKKDFFKIYANAVGVENHIDLLRFRKVGTYRIRTYPELQEKDLGGDIIIPDPPPCSGFEYRDNIVQYVGECTCCYCWITEKDDVPTVFNENYTGLDVFNHVYVGTIAVTPNSFSDRYHVAVQQLSLTNATYQFWNQVRAQKAGATDIFQPPIGSLKGNARSHNEEDAPLGIFWAAGVSTKSIFLNEENLPYPLGNVKFAYKTSCTELDFSSNRKPSFWP